MGVQTKQTLAWIDRYLDVNPEASVDKIAKAGLAAGVPMRTSDITLARRLHNAKAQPSAPLAAVPPSFVIKDCSPFCNICLSSDHWTANCTAVDKMIKAVAVEELTKDARSAAQAIDVALDKAAAAERAERERIKEEARKRAIAAQAEAEAELDKEEQDQPEEEQDDMKSGTAADVLEYGLTKAELELGRQHRAGMEVRRRYLNAIVDREPNIEPREAMRRVGDAFGVSVGASYAYETCRLAREVNNLEPVEERAPGRTTKTGAAATRLEDIARQFRDVCKASGTAEAVLEYRDGKVTWNFKMLVERGGSLD